MPTFDERFRKVADWCASNGVPAGFPNCHEDGTKKPALHGTILINQGVTWRDVPRSTLGNPTTDRTRLTSAHDYAVSQNFAHGFPNFHQAGSGSSIVYGTFLLDAAAVTWQDVPVASILGSNIDPSARPMENWFTGAHDWAMANGRPAAMPNGHYAQYNGTWVVGVFSFNPGFAQWRDLTATELKYPVNLTVGGGW
jgi:hypothetical protein